MSKKFISFFLSVLMVFSILGGYSEVFAAGDKSEYLVYVDEASIAGYKEAMLDKDFSLARSLADKTLDLVENELKDKVNSVEVFDRVELLLPLLAVKMNASDVDKVKAIANVKAVYINEEISESDVLRSDMAVFRDRAFMSDSIKMVESNDLISNDEALQSKYDGRGSVLAIIDSNMDPSHRAFYLSNDVVPRLSQMDIDNFMKNKKISVNAPIDEIYRSDKIPFGWNYMVGSSDLNPEREKEAHGQHVSGTVGGNRDIISGKTWRGVAPESQLLMMNVMRKGSTTALVYVKAMTDAIAMNADAVNMSLGATKALPGSADGAVGNAIDNGYLTDTNFVIAAGNEGEYQGNLNIDYPDYGTIGSPGIATNAITVASLENKVMYTTLVTYDGVKYAFNTGGDVRFDAGDYEYVDCLLGKPEDFEGKDLNGKVALIKRGGITFSEKVLNAEKAGAVGAVIYNNVEGPLYMSVSGNKIPAISIELATAEKMLEGTKKTVNIDMNPQETSNPQYGELSTFTNWGLSAGGYMKPDITAPGGHIYSTQTMGNTYGDMSGTSMATPHVTGGVGVIRERLKEMEFSNVEHKAALTKTILMNSAVPHVDPKTKSVTSPRRQGAGVMNLTNASKLDFTVVDRDTKIASKYVGNVDDKITLNLTVHNYSNRVKEITPAVQATIEARDGKKLLLRPDELFSNTYEDQKFTIGAGEEKNVTITFPIEHMEKVEPFTNGAFVEGFLHLRDQQGMEASFPFVSFKGKYETIPSLEKPLYDFDFETEKPMFWNLGTRYHDWYKYSTHIETNFGTYRDDKGTLRQNTVIAGLKNFNELNETKNTDKEVKPEFEKIVLSPNGDGYHDTLELNMVAVRSALFSASVINEKNEAKNYNIGVKRTNISFDPDNKDGREGYLGYTAPGAIPLNNFKDGEYTLRISAEAIKSKNEKYPATFTDMKFVVDTVSPEFTNAKFDEEKNVLSFDIVEAGSGLRDFTIKTNDKDIPFERNEGKVTLNIPDGVKLSDIDIHAVDLGYNAKDMTAEMLVFKDLFGKLEVEVVQNGTEPLNLEYEIVDENGNVLENKENLKFGKYKLVVKSYSNKYELKGDKEINFEISENEKNKKIVLEFNIVPTARLSIRVDSKEDLKWTDFRIFAKNVSNEKVFEFFQDQTSGVMEKYWDADLPYGDYEFYVTFKEGIEGYVGKFAADFPYTVNASSDWGTVNLNIIREGFYKVNVADNLQNKVKYLARRSDKDEVVELDSIGAGSWMIFPEEIPEGMYLEQPFKSIILSEKHPHENVDFEFKEIGNQKFKFTITDNHEGAKYYIADFYEWINRDNGKTYEYKNGGIELTPGFYYVEATPDEYGFGETEIEIDGKTYKQDSRTFKSVTEPVNINFNWIKYTDTEKMSEGVIRVNDDALPQNLRKNAYKYTLTDGEGKVTEHVYGKANFSSWFVDLPYNIYSVKIDELPAGYTVKPSEFTVAYSQFGVELVVVKEADLNKVDVDVKFVCEGKEISPVKFKLGNHVYSDGMISVLPGTYDISIVSAPDGYKLVDENQKVVIDKSTESLTFEMEKGEVVPQEKGTLTFKAVEFDGKTEKEITSIMFANANEYFLRNGEAKEVPYGEYNVVLSSTWNMYGKYDADKSETTKKVVVDKENPNPVVIFKLVLKGADAGPTPSKDTGTASWDLNYTGLNKRDFFEKVKLFKITENGEEEVKLLFEQEYKKGSIELPYGKYAYVLQDLPGYLKVEVKNPRIEFTLDEENPTFKAVFEVLDKLEKQKVDIKMPKNTDDISKLTFKVFDKNDKEAEVTMTNTGFEFPAVQGEVYKIVVEGNKFPYFPNYIKAYPGTFPKYINFTAPLPVEIKSMAGDTPVRAKYVVVASNVYGTSITEDLKMIPYIPTENQVYTVKFVSVEQGYKLDDKEEKSFTVTQYGKYGVEFNFVRDESVEVVDRGELEKLINEYDKIKSTDAYKNASEELRSAYDSLIALGKAELEKDATTQSAIDELVKKIVETRDEIIGSPVKLLKQELKSLLDEADEIRKTDKYTLETEEKKAAYDNAIEAGLRVYEEKNATVEDVKSAIKEIKDTKASLDGFKEANKEELKKLIDEFDTVRASKKYLLSTEEEKMAYQNAITVGNRALKNRKATQEEVDEAVRAINEAFNNLSGVEEEKVVVTFDFDNGEEENKVEIVKGKKVTRPKEPTKEGYKFVGWFLDGNEFDFDSIVTRDLRIVAKWEKIEEIKEVNFEDMLYNGEYDHFRSDIEIGWMKYRFGVDLTESLLRDANNERTTLKSYIDGERPTVILLGDILSFKAKRMWREVLDIKRDFNLVNGITTGTKWQLDSLLKSREFAGSEEFFARNAGTIHILTPIEKPAMFILDKNGRLINYGKFDVELMKKMVETAKKVVVEEKSEVDPQKKGNSFEDYKNIGLYNDLDTIGFETSKKLFGKDAGKNLVFNTNSLLVNVNKIAGNKLSVLLVGDYNKRETADMFLDAKTLVDEGINAYFGVAGGTIFDVNRMKALNTLKNYNDRFFSGAQSLRKFTGLKGNIVIVLDKEGKTIAAFNYNGVNQIKTIIDLLK